VFRVSYFHGSSSRAASRTEITMAKETEDNDQLVFGDEAAARVVNLSVLQIRQLRRGGQLKGAWAQFGYRTFVYRPKQLKECVAALFNAA
jgi:hypothetical protein